MDYNEKISSWLNSGEYMTDIDQLRTNIMKASATSNSESTTASIFERNIYYIIKLKTGIDLNFEKEKALIINLEI